MKKKVTLFWISKEIFVRFILTPFLVFAERYLAESIFECDNLEGKNFFEFLTDFTKFVMRKNFGNSVYDYKKSDCRIREMVFTIDLRSVRNDSQSQNNKNLNESKTRFDFNNKIMNILNNSKTLVGRFSTILLPTTRAGDEPVACILLELKLCRRRQNFDDFLWKQIFS